VGVGSFYGGVERKVKLVPIANCRLPIYELMIGDNRNSNCTKKSEIGSWQSILRSTLPTLKGIRYIASYDVKIGRR
jgi:hypothetical protein